MFRKIAAVIAFGVGGYFGYKYANQIITYYSSNFQGYWGELGAQVIRVATPIAVGVVAALVVYFVLNLFARAE